MIYNNLESGSFIIVGNNAKKLVFDFVSNKLKCDSVKIINHPDCKVIDNCDIIEIDNIREANYFLSLTPSLIKNKFLIIDNFHLANVYAQNAFLKTFEEPPNYAYIFLLTPYEDRLLSTIKSRGQIIYIDNHKLDSIDKKQNNKYEILDLIKMNDGQKLMWLDKELEGVKEKSDTKKKILEKINIFFVECDYLLKQDKINYKNLEILKEIKFKIEQGFPNPKILFESFLLSL